MLEVREAAPGEIQGEQVVDTLSRHQFFDASVAAAFLDYHKPLQDTAYQLLFRKNDTMYYPRLSIDIGESLSDTEFRSYGWIDISMEVRTGKKGNMKTYASCLLATPAHVADVIADRSMAHADKEKNSGLFVTEDLRGQGVGTSLISYGRAVVSKCGIRSLLFEAIDKMEDGEPRGTFYRAAHVRFYDRHQSEETLHDSADGVIFTAASQKRPYKFP